MRIRKIGDNLYQRQDGVVINRNGDIIHDRKSIVDKVIDAVTPNEAPKPDIPAPEGE